MKGEDRLGLADRVAEVGVRPFLKRLHLLGTAVDQRHRRHRDLVEQRPQGVGEAELPGRLQVAAAGEHRDRDRLARQLRHRPGRQQVGLARRRPDAQQGELAALLELAGELELLRGHVVEAAEVHVVAAGVEAGAHGREVDPVCGRVDEHLHSLELLREIGGRVGLAGLRLAAPVLHRHRLGLAQVDVEQAHRGDLLGLREVPDDRRRDRPAGAEDRDPHAISSRARRASQSSTRSFARLRSRPVSSSMRLIR